MNDYRQAKEIYTKRIDTLKYVLNQQDRAKLNNFDKSGVSNIKNPDKHKDLAEIDIGLLELDIAFVILQITQHLKSIYKEFPSEDWEELDDADKSIFLHESKKLLMYILDKYIEKTF